MLITKLDSKKHALYFLIEIATVNLLFIIATPTTMSQSLLSREQVEEIVIRQAKAWETQDSEAIAIDKLGK